MAIIEYLEETHPQPPLLPADPAGRARVRALALDIACEIHPLNNLRVLRYLVRDLKLSDDDKDRWYRHWVETGLETVERQMVAAPGTYCHGDTPSLADCMLVPQIFNAKRFNCRLEHVPQVMRVFEACMKLDAFERTRPEHCPDAE
jgi:maleylacetoacetate isomerase/maleylpyruvate isomerase